MKTFAYALTKILGINIIFMMIPNPIFAQDDWTITPSRSVFTEGIEIGDTIDFGVKVTNNTSLTDRKVTIDYQIGSSYKIQNGCDSKTVALKNLSFTTIECTVVLSDYEDFSFEYTLDLDGTLQKWYFKPNETYENVFIGTMHSIEGQSASDDDSEVTYTVDEDSIEILKEDETDQNEETSPSNKLESEQQDMEAALDLMKYIVSFLTFIVIPVVLAIKIIKDKRNTKNSD